MNLRAAAPVSADRTDLPAAMAAWTLFCDLGLDSDLVWHVSFAGWGLCDCERCRWDAEYSNGVGRPPTEADDDHR